MAPDSEWLKKEFSYGYDSGEVRTPEPDEVRRREEEKIGGSYYRIYRELIVPNVRKDSHVLELDPGRGSWTRAILDLVPYGEVHTVDFQDVTKWLDPGDYHGRLVCHQVSENDYSELPREFFDFFWSFGVLCHNNLADIKTILKKAKPLLVKGAVCIHQYADWEKLDKYGWEKGAIPVEFQQRVDDEIWWPRNSRAEMAKLIEEAG